MLFAKPKNISHDSLIVFAHYVFSVAAWVVGISINIFAKIDSTRAWFISEPTCCTAFMTQPNCRENYQNLVNDLRFQDRCFFLHAQLVIKIYLKQFKFTRMHLI